MTNSKFTKHEITAITSLRGYFHATWDEVIEQFGQPDYEAMGEKVTAEWSLIDNAGHVYTIYDWKHSASVCRSGARFRWHVGGTDQTDPQKIRNVFGQ